MQSPTPYLDRLECRASFGDYLIARLRGRTTDDTHPIAAQQIADGVGLGQAVSRAYGAPDTGSELYRWLVQGSDFPSTLAHAITLAISGDSSAASREHRQLARQIETRDLKPHSIGRVEVGDIEAAPLSNMIGTVPQVDTSQFVSGAASIYSANLLVGRPMLVGDQLSIIRDAVQQVVDQLLKVEPRSIATLLETSIPTMPDGAAWIAAGNTTSSTGLDATSLDEAADLLRTSVNNAGSLLNAAPRYLVVPAGKEIAAHVLTAALGTPSPVIALCNPWLGGSYSYLFSDPASEPALLRLVLSGSSGEPQVMQRRTPIEYDGLGLVIEHTVGYAAVSRAVARIPMS